MATTTGYTYLPLGRNEIRLLKVLPTADLRFKIIHYNLSRSLNYAALSYTWGEPVLCRVVNLDGNAFLVTDNLYEALRNLKARQLQKKNSQTWSKYIWIDQICINQNNIEEKSSQIPLMKRIYEEASRVIVWLGNPENSAQIARGVQLIDKTWKKASRRMWRRMPLNILLRSHRPSPMPQLIVTNEHTFSALSGFSIDDPTIWDIEGSLVHDAWLGIRAIFESPWWTRTWVYQEATTPEKWFKKLSGDSAVIFLCGPSFTTWTRLSFIESVAISLLATGLPETAFMRGIVVAHGRLSRLISLRQERSNVSLIDLLGTFRYSQCRDPRDKVFAPLCLAPNHIIRKVRIDYSKPVREVYLDVLKACLSDPRHKLDFLGYTMKIRKPARESTGVTNLRIWPSWLPNWDQTVVIDPIQKEIRVLVGREVSSYEKLNGRLHYKVRAYNASGGSRVKGYISGDHLTIKGVHCDIIQDILSDEPNATLEAKLKIWAAAANYKYFTGEEWRAALMRTLAMDLRHNLNGTSERNFSYDRDLRGNPFVANSSLAHRVRFRKMLLGIAANTRNICLTTKGYIGLVPKAAEVGDIVCVLLGGQVLYTLRYPGGEDECEYIGEAYIQGLMDGEVMKWVANGAALVETFIIA